MSALGDALYADYLAHGRGEVTLCPPARAAGNLPLARAKHLVGFAKYNRAIVRRRAAQVLSVLKAGGASMTLAQIAGTDSEKELRCIDRALTFLVQRHAVTVTPGRPRLFAAVRP